MEVRRRWVTFSFIFVLPKIYPYIKAVMFFILIFVSAYLVLREKESRLPALMIFLLSGFLGLATLNLPIKESLLPLLTGLFGSSSLITFISGFNCLYLKTAFFTNSSHSFCSGFCRMGSTSRFCFYEKFCTIQEPGRNTSSSPATSTSSSGDSKPEQGTSTACTSTFTAPV